MNNINKCLLITALSSVIAACQSTPKVTDTFTYKVGDKVEALANIHVDTKGYKIYAMNYQSAILLPVCTQFTIKAITKDAVKLTYNDVEYNYLWDKYTRKVRSFSKSFDTNFGEKCDTEKLAQLSDIDKDGVKQGKALIGMSKQGVTFAMGPPPAHANPSAQSDSWLYWRNRWMKRGIDFSSEGKVNKIR